jgi:hypothetical protein
MPNCLGYTVDGYKASSVIYPVENDLKNTLLSKDGEEQVLQLSSIIRSVLEDNNHVYSAPFVFNLSFGGVRYSSFESVLSFLLFQRGVKLCNLALGDNDKKKVNRAFLDFNYAIYFAITPEMLGLCSLYRAYFLPKKSSEDEVEKKFMQNELNIAKKTLGNDANIFHMLSGGYHVNDVSSALYYHFLSECLEEGCRYQYSSQVIEMTQYKPYTFDSPINYLREIPDGIHGYLLELINSSECSMLNEYKVNMENVRII